VGDNGVVAVSLRERFTPPVRIPRWRFWLGTFLIVLAWALGGTLLSFAVLPFTGADFQVLFVDGDIFGALPGWGFLLFALVSFIPLLAGTLLAYRFVLLRPLTQLFALGVRFRMWRVWWGFAAWIVIMGSPTVLALVFAPDSYRWNFSAAVFIPFAVIALLLLPVQTTAEEVFFRGWLMQWFSQRFSNIWILSILSGVVFSIPHLANPEALGAIVPAFFGYGMVGFVLGWVTVRDRSLEIAIGAHAANNLFASLLIGYEGGALPADGLFVAEQFEWGAGNLISLVLVPLFIVATRFGREARPSRSRALVSEGAEKSESPTTP
jgi:uncharacterized protein